MDEENTQINKAEKELSLVERVKADLRIARFAKNREKVTMLSTLLGELVRIGKDDGNRETTDQEAITLVSRFIANLRELKAARPSDTAIDYEVTLLQAYLPEPLTHHELELLVTKAIQDLKASSLKDMKNVMNFFRENYLGRFNPNHLARTVKGQLEDYNPA